MTGIACLACGHPWSSLVTITLGDGRIVPARLCPCGFVWRTVLSRAEADVMMTETRDVEITADWFDIPQPM